MQRAAARVGPSIDPSVRRISVRFLSGATICIENTIKASLLSVFRRFDTRQNHRSRRHRKKRAKFRRERQARRTPVNTARYEGEANGALRYRRSVPSENLERLRNFGDVWLLPTREAASFEHRTRLIYRAFLPNTRCVTRWPGSCEVSTGPSLRICSFKYGPVRHASR